MGERVADPLLAGVYGGSANELSVQSVMPRFLEMEAKHGSLGRAMVAAGKQRDTESREPCSTGQTRASVPTRSRFTSLRNGRGQRGGGLLGRVTAAGRRLDAGREAVSPESGRW